MDIERSGCGLRRRRSGRRRVCARTGLVLGSRRCCPAIYLGWGHHRACWCGCSGRGLSEQGTLRTVYVVGRRSSVDVVRCGDKGEHEKW